MIEIKYAVRCKIKKKRTFKQLIEELDSKADKEIYIHKICNPRIPSPFLRYFSRCEDSTDLRWNSTNPGAHVALSNW